MTYKTNMRLHSDNIGSPVPKGFYTVVAVYPVMEMMEVKREISGKIYLVAMKEEIVDANV